MEFTTWGGLVKSGKFTHSFPFDGDLIPLSSTEQFPLPSWGHWVLVVLDMNSLTCYYFDSLRPHQPDQDLEQIVDVAIMLYAAQSGSSKRHVLKWVTRVCPSQ